MIELKKITLKEYLELEDKSEYDFAIKYANAFKNPIDEYHIGDVTELPFGFVKDFQYELESGLNLNKLIELIGNIIKIKDIGNEPLDKFMRFSNYLIESIKQIIEIEEKSLAHEPTEREIAAGMERFNGLGVYLQIRSLTQGDITKYEEVRKLPYSLCLTEMYTAKQLSDYERDLIKLSQPTN